jgi:hypothetical protein
MALKAWIKQEGTEGRRRLFKAIQAEFPSFTQVSLTNYIQGQRVPDYQVAKIISEVTGIPIIFLPFRFVYNPENELKKL